VPAGKDGDCDPPSVSNRKIRIRKGLEPGMELEIVLHELLHAAFWDFDEVAVSEAAADISTVLRKLGWRKDQ